MTSTFATLMAISASNTQASQRAAQQALAEKKRKEEEEMRKRAERDRKEKELEARLRLKHFEDEKRERERKEREDKLNEEKEKLREKKEAMARDKLLGNVKKASRSRSPSYPGVNPGSRDELRKKRLPSDEEDEGASFLTREEKRERRRMAGLNSGAGRTKKSTTGSGAPYRSKKPLPGGGLDSGGASQNSGGSPSQSVKARLAAMPNTLLKLNVNKRDTRTIDEIIRDREKSKEGRVLNGEQAKEFNDWFGKKRDTTGLAKKTAALDLSANDSRSETFTLPSKPASSSTLNKKQSTASLPSFSKTKDPLKPSPPKPNSASTRPVPSSRPSGSGTAKPRPSSAHIPSSAGKKHRRSESFSEDEEEYDSPPSKKRYAPSAQDDYRSEIWKLFGKDRSTYVNDVVDSDEDDMEADAMDLEKEELRSARLARKEDEQALREEKMREYEKRKKKLEKERERR
ncbi:SPT2 chromatin protein-domain-containing protein [Thelephora terrestris]|uniref:SPT2 chromatin protein-domain-containing protein n=1 Tax=Thelephora terrestris TaxID=56493 RepID=A0A9P6LB14_9AGAM|nr:SPT2 chromatin protein-domain-containing protein [Thelephora terrestris]